MRRISYEQFLEELQAQGVPPEHYAFKCPVCGTVQSAQDFFNAGAATDMDNVQKYLGFSCVGRFTDAGPHKKENTPGAGCNWTLGGLFQLHKLEVERDGERYKRFENASREEAQEHMRRNTAAVAV